MICFCAGRFHWLRLWQNPGELLPPGLSDMATRALLYRRPPPTFTLLGHHGPPLFLLTPPRQPPDPSTLVVTHGSQFFSIKLRRHRRARRYTLRIHPTDRAAILTMPPRGTIAEAREFAKMHG